MKGVVFTEFLDMVADRFSPDMVEDIIDDAQLPSGGAYTAVGTYPHEEMVAMADGLGLYACQVAAGAGFRHGNGRNQFAAHQDIVS